MTHPSEPTDRETALLLRTMLRRRRAGLPLDIDASGELPQSGRVKDLLDALDRVEVARSRVEHAVNDTESMLAAGNLALEGYELLRPLGIGGHGIVHQARRLLDGQLVAVKFMREWNDPNADDRRRFEREAKVHRDLNHRGIVPVLEVGRTSAGVDYLVMPFIDGRPLNPGREKNAKTLNELLSLFLSICRAVAAAHENGIIHRDLKPANILIDTEGCPHLVDFGLATHACSESVRQSMQTNGKPLGTYLWCSYEQLDGTQKLTPASDVFSLGIILHQLLVGRFPSDVLSVLETILEQPELRDPTRRELTEAIRPDLRHIIERCLHRDPAERYPNAGLLAEDIGRALTYCPAPSRRRRWILLASLVTAAAVATGFWISLHRIQPVTTPFNKFGRPAIILSTRADNETRMHYLAPGTFMMGASPNYLDPMADEKPHEVTIAKGFYIADRETTQSLYESIMDINPSRFKGVSLPVERVTYEDAVEFCRRLSIREGRVYRLPTEAEWEYACRAGSTTTFAFGDDGNLMMRQANVADLSNTEDTEMAYRSPWDDRYPRTAPVATFLSNAWQLADMHGNVWEWCQAPYVANPLDVKTAVPNYACVRGGSWWDDPNTCRSSNRNPQPITNKTSTIGFRIVCEAN